MSLINQIDEIRGTTNTEAALRAGAALGEIKANPHDKRHSLIVVPEGYKTEDIYEPEVPVRQVGTVNLRDVASFIAYFNRQKRDCSLIYAKMEPASFLAVIDDHHKFGDVGSDGVGANWREYRANFVVPASREWKTWTGRNGAQNKMTQLDFATFVEDNLPDIVSPSGGDMLTLALNFEAAKDARFISNTRMQDGSVEFMWKENVEASASNKLAMPQMITIEIPVFENGPAVSMQARIKFRINNGDLSIWYELVRPHKVLEAGFRELWDKIAAETKTTILLGSPE